MERNISIPISTVIPFWDYRYFIKSSNLVVIECKNHVSKSQSAHNLLLVLINDKMSHLKYLKRNSFKHL